MPLLGPDISSHPPTRPKFNHRDTSDRLREGSGRPLSFHMTGKRRKDRKSIFKELGLDTEDINEQHYPGVKEFGEITGLGTERKSTSTSSNRASVHEHEGAEGKSRVPQQYQQQAKQHQQCHQHEEETPRSATSEPSSKPWYAKLTPGRRPRIRTVSSAPPPSMSGLTRLSTIALLIAVVLPGCSYYNGREKVSLNGADAGVIRPQQGRKRHGSGPILESRADSPTKVCTRWSQQAAQLNGTLYIYGGQATSSEGQTTNTWNNNFLTLDLTKSWDVSSPSLTGLAQPSGPPAVANGYLWNDYNSLYLYGGEFADNPYVEPCPISTWKYSVGSRSWTEYPNPQTSAGNNSDPGGAPVQRSGEGAGLSVPELGLSWYFGGHLDLATTPGWSNQIARVYLKSLLEFTHPGFSNDGVDSLRSSGAGDGGAYRNVTQGGLQADSGFSERADGVLVFVPGWGARGVLIGLAGGTDSAFSNDLSTLDVYDIASSQWYHQQAGGRTPTVRVNPCAVVASAPDASSFQVYLYGGQNLQPYREQIQYADMYILSIPAFTWINVTSQAARNGPAARAGHTCNLRDGQMVVVGGYVGSRDIPCDSPGVYVFNATSLEWTGGFAALDHPDDIHPENSVLAGSYGYKVPDVVASVIGGDGDGHATATTPSAGPATGGPFATGKPPIFTVTTAGSTATVTSWGPGATAAGGSTGDDSRRPGLIAAGVVAGLAGLLAAYLGYCAWLYRRQVKAYRSHLAVANRYDPAAQSTGGLSGRGLAAFFGGGSTKRERKKTEGEGEGAGGSAADPEKEEGGCGQVRGTAGHRRMVSESASTADSAAMGMPPTEPKLMLVDDPTPSSGYGSSSRTASSKRPTAWWNGFGGAGNNSLTPGASSSTPGTTPETGAAPGSGPPKRSGSSASSSSTEGLLDGQEPSFFSVVMGPRRALRVVNGLEGDGEGGAAERVAAAAAAAGGGN